MPGSPAALMDDDVKKPFWFRCVGNLTISGLPKEVLHVDVCPNPNNANVPVSDSHILRCPLSQLPSLFLSPAIVTIHIAMLSESHWKSLRQSLLVLFTSSLLIGVTMLAITSEINPVGFFFLTVGGVCLVGYLISVAAEHWLKRHNPADENSAAPGRHFEAGDNEAYEAPSYDEVAATGYSSTSAIWTINTSPASSPVEPPPYSVVIEPPAHGETVVEAFTVSVAPGTRRASEADAQSRLRLRLVLPPRLQRFVSDTHELKDTEERHDRLEPLTPPPAYENVIGEEIFEEEFQPTRL